MRRNRWDPRHWSVLQWVLVLVLIVSAAGAVRWVTRDRSCFPGQPQATPASVAAGERVVVTSTGFICARRFHRGALYGLEIVPASGAADGADQVDLGDFPVARDGKFPGTDPGALDRRRRPVTIRVTGFDVDELYDEVCSEQDCGTFGASVVVR